MLNKEQQLVLTLIDRGENVFATGKAGTGKSYLIKELILKSNKTAFVTAAFGVAANNISGSTIHSFAGLVICSQPFEFLIKHASADSQQRLTSVELLIIDEISILSVDILITLNRLLQHYKKKLTLFGGCQLLVTGDFYQLGPPQSGRELLFLDPFWELCRFKTVMLNLNFRQKDTEFQDYLSLIRIADTDNDVVDYFMARVIDNDDTVDTNLPRLVFTNKEKNVYNERKYAANLNTPTLYISVDDIKTSNIVHFATPNQVSLKIGCAVMCVRNDFENNLSNGTYGTVVKMGEKWVEITTSTGNKIIEVREEKLTDKDNKVIARRTGLPLILAHAMTVHKVQGLTFDGLVAFVNKKQFTPHLFYVMISRAKSYNNLYLVVERTFLKTFLLTQFYCDSRVHTFYKNIKYEQNLKRKL